jgi:hypothetical protein
LVFLVLCGEVNCGIDFALFLCLYNTALLIVASYASVPAFSALLLADAKLYLVLLLEHVTAAGHLLAHEFRQYLY